MEKMMENSESSTEVNRSSSEPVTLSGLADGMDAHDERENAIGRILAHHVRNRRELDRVCERLGALDEENADLKGRLAAVEARLKVVESSGESKGSNGPKSEQKQTADKGRKASRFPF
jgi:hypothetical protein